MRLVAAVGLPPQWLARERDVASDCGICGLALQDNCLQVDAQAASCRRRVGPIVGEGESGPALALPLHCRGRPIGVFNLFFGAGERDSADLSRLLEPVRDMLDLVIENALLEQERLQSSLVAERQLLAGEVHDSLAQSLAYMRMRMTLLHDAVEDGESARALKYFDDVNAVMSEAHGRLRELITQFRSGVEHGLARALEGIARTFEERTGVALRIDNRVADLRLPPEQEIQVYRIVQEVLANAARHANARELRLCVALDRHGTLEVAVTDDGQGFDPRTVSKGRGLANVRSRASLIGAEVEWRPGAQGGTSFLFRKTQAAAGLDG